MKPALFIAAIAVGILAGVVALDLLPDARADNGVSTAAEQTVTFTVNKMTCAACPITVRTAMEKVEGVKSVDVDFAAKTATVVFDPGVATPAKIGAASTNAGYPASPKS